MSIADSFVPRASAQVGYMTAVLRTAVSAVREMLNLPEYLALMNIDEIPVDMDAPNESARYPYVHVMYKHSKLRPAQLNDAEYQPIERGDMDVPSEIAYYIFNGQIQVNIYAVSYLERETISDILLGALAADPRFKEKIEGAGFINMTVNLDTFESNTANESWGTPWSPDIMTAFRQWSFNVTGEFAWTRTSPATFIESIRVLPSIQP